MPLSPTLPLTAAGDHTCSSDVKMADRKHDESGELHDRSPVLKLGDGRGRTDGLRRADCELAAMQRSATAASRRSQAHLSRHLRLGCARSARCLRAFAPFLPKSLTWRGAFSDDDDATQATCAQDARWRAGVNRQAQPQAHQHQVNASWAAAQKRKERAMSGEEHKAKRAARARVARAEQAAPPP